MPNRWPITSGNWSNAAIWSGSIIPTASDDVFANSQSIFIDTDITVLTLRNSSGTGITAGGIFYINNGVNINLTANPAMYHTSPAVFAVTNTPLVIISGSNSATITGSLGSTTYGPKIHLQNNASLQILGNIVSTSNTSNIGIRHSSSGTLTITGSLTGGGGQSAPVLYIDNSGSVNIFGNVTAGSATTCHGISNITGNNNVNINGNVTGGTATTAYGINNSGGGSSTTIMGNVSSGTGASSLGIAQFGANSTLQVTGSVIANTTAGIQANSGANVSIYVSGSVVGGPTNTVGAIFKTTTGVLQIIGPITAGLNCPAIETNTNVTSLFLTGPFYNINNRNALNVPMFQLISGSTPTWTFDTETALEQRTLYTADFPGNFPSASNVRQGTVFGNTGQFTGVVAIPSASNVLLSVPVGNTTGSASFNTQNVWSVATSSLTATGSIGERLRNAATVATDAASIITKGTL